MLFVSVFLCVTDFFVVYLLSGSVSSAAFRSRDCFITAVEFKYSIISTHHIRIFFKHLFFVEKPETLKLKLKPVKTIDLIAAA